jgi:hypothetical protein
MEKLFKQRLQPAPSVDCVRTGVPSWLVAMVNKLLAKNPDKRYQTPAELIADLAASICRTPSIDRSVCPKTQTLQEVETLLGDRNPFPFPNRIAIATEPRLPGPQKPVGWSLLSRGSARLVTVVTACLLAVKRGLRGG